MQIQEFQPFQQIYTSQDRELADALVEEEVYWIKEAESLDTADAAKLIDFVKAGIRRIRDKIAQMKLVSSGEELKKIVQRSLQELRVSAEQFRNGCESYAKNKQIVNAAFHQTAEKINALNFDIEPISYAENEMETRKTQLAQCVAKLDSEDPGRDPMNCPEERAKGLTPETMQVNEPNPLIFGLKYYENRDGRIKTINNLKEEFEKKYQPAQENAVRDATIRAAIKVGLVLCLPNHWITGVAIGAGPVAEMLQKPIENIKCPKIDTELFHAMMMMPTCQESKEAVLMGLKAIKQPNKLLNKVTEEISQYIIPQADRAGITENNIKQIAAVAHRLITKTAPATAKRIYKQWIENPLADAKGQNEKPLLN